MSLSRRSFFTQTGAGILAGSTLLHAAGKRGLKIGVTDWNLQLSAKVEAVALAHRIGFDGVEVSLGRKPVDGKLPLDNAELQAQYLAAAKEQGIALAGTCLDILHTNYLKNDKLGQKWVADSIPITKKLKAGVVLMPFFGKGAMTTPEEMDYVGDLLRELAPEAEKAGILLGLEDTNSAEQNVRIMERSRSKAVRVYYDVGNSTGNGFEVVKEIRWLGKARICQIHLKDNPGYMGEGKIDFPAVMRAIAEIGFEGFANLETSSPAHSIEADMNRNLSYIKKVMGANG
jgi:sugar phosphate isomerase/epimerase